MIDKNDPRLTDFVLGELSDSEGAKIQNAIAQSPELAGVVDEIRQTIGMIGDAYRAEEPLSLRDAQKEALAKAHPEDDRSGNELHSRSPSSASSGSWLRHRWLQGVLAASLMGLLVGGALYLNNPSPTEHLALEMEGMKDVDRDELKSIESTKEDDEQLEFPSSVMDGVSDLENGDKLDKPQVEMEVAGRFPPSQAGAGGGRIAGEGAESKRSEDKQTDAWTFYTPIVDTPMNEPLPSAMVLDRTESMGLEGESSIEGFSSRLSFSGKRDELDLRGGLDLRFDQGSFDAAGETGVLGGWRGETRGANRVAGSGRDGRKNEELGRRAEQLAGGPLTGAMGFPGDLRSNQSRTARKSIAVPPTVTVPGRLERPEVSAQAPASPGAGGGRMRSRAAVPAKEPATASLSRRLGKSKEKDGKEEIEVLKRTWKRVKAIPNTSRLMLGDKSDLDLAGMQVNVQIDGFRARVLIDCFYYNDREDQLEADFKLRLPDDASLYYFAFGESAYEFDPQGEWVNDEFLGQDDAEYVSFNVDEIRQARKDVWANVKESRMVPREQAALAYRETVRQKVDPALVEWSGAGVFHARIYPLTLHKLHRIVIGYDVNLKKTGDDLVYELELPEQTGNCRVDLRVLPIQDVNYRIAPVCDPIEEVVDGTTFARYRFSGQKIGTIQLLAHDVPEVLLESPNDAKGKFWGVQVTPELPREEVSGAARAIFLVDTSLSSSPDKFNVWLKMLEATLTNNRDSLKQFGVLFFNVSGNFWQEKYVDNTPENVVALLKTCNTLSLEGATDLYGAIEKINRAPWVNGSDSSLRGERSGTPDLFLLSDGAANWGETNLRLISRQLENGKLGRLFAYQTGLGGTAISGLRFLAGQSGGAVFSVSTEAEVKVASTAHRNRPWELKSVSSDGATDLMTAGRVRWVYPGQVITVVGRGTVEETIELVLEQDGKAKTHSVTPVRVESELASRLYGQVAVGQLESLGANVFDISTAYARHFRVTGRTCSLLMLESEAIYQRFNIVPEEDWLVIKTKSASVLVMETLEKFALDLADPKAQLLAWMARLETMDGVHFKMPTALKLAMDDIQVVAISESLEGGLTRKDGLSQQYLDAMLASRLDYDTIEAEARRRSRTSVDEAIKVFSSLVERNPGDLVIARDVAFTAMEMDRPAPAFHLLRNVARRRPFEGSVYPALGQCLTKLGQADMAIVYYEIALGGDFQNQGADFRKIVSAEYLHLLRQIGLGKIESSVKGYAAARRETLRRELQMETADLLITMMWNTNETDVDLHVTEPSGEECSYENKRTRAGGQITSDITTGFGPEMYFIADAPQGKYEIRVKYFSSGQRRTELRNKVHLTIYRGFGTDDERVTRKTVMLKTVGKKESVATVGVGK